jgi:alkyl hydroperoxide reductase subunit F
MLDTSILQQVTEIFRNLEANYTFRISYAPQREESSQLIEFLNDFASTSTHLSVEKHEADGDALAFDLLKNGQETGITFRGIPNGHEFTSLLLAVLNADGKGKNLPDEGITGRIRSLSGDIRLQTYVSLTCTNCPDVVQTLNIFALLNPGIRHEMVDGALFQSEVDAKGVQAVPSVFADGKLIHVGRGSLGELLEKLEEVYPSCPVNENGENAPIHRVFDVLVLGGGPAGASAAIYSARKGLKVAMVAERIGGQVKETVGIENLISVP